MLTIFAKFKIIFLMPALLFTIAGFGQERDDSIMKAHTKIVKDKIGIQIATPTNSNNFCLSLRKAKLPPLVLKKDTAGASNGRYLLIKFIVNKMGRVVYLKEKTGNIDISKTVEDIKKAISQTKWEKLNQSTTTIFSCLISPAGLNNIVLRSVDNFKRINYCE